MGASISSQNMFRFGNGSGNDTEVRSSMLSELRSSVSIDIPFFGRHSNKVTDAVLENNQNHSSDSDSDVSNILKSLIQAPYSTEEQRKQLQDVLAKVEKLQAQVGQKDEQPLFINTVRSSEEVDDDTKDYLLSFTQEHSQHGKFKKVANAVVFSNRLTKLTEGNQTEEDFKRFYQGPRLTDAVREEMEKVASWDFDVFKVAELTNNRPLQTVAHYILHQEGYMQQFSITHESLINFLTAVEDGYHDVPYHNRLHAADVFQSLYVLLKSGFDQNLTPLELFAAFIAALVHDLGHRGLTNDFLIETNDPIAIVYNDMSVNENGHLAAAFKIMLQDDSNILAGLSRQQYVLLREICVNMILSTDMKLHSSLITDFNQAFEDGKNKLENIPSLLLLKMLLHMADISNGCKPLHLSQQWSQRVLSEFFQQGDRQRILGRKISPLCDRDTVNVAKAQVGFFDFIVRPTLLCLHQVAPLNFALANLDSVKAYWTQQAAEDEQAKVQKSG